MEDLEELKIIKDPNGIYNISLVKEHKYFIIISKEYVK